MTRFTLAGFALLITYIAAVNAMPGHLFAPLTCNENIDDAAWEKWTETELPTSSTTNVVEVPCGRRILMDLTGAIAFGGLVIHGHLKFEDNGIHITTDHVIVQGFLTIGEHQNPVTNKVIFTLTGTSEPDVGVLEAVREDCGGHCVAGIQAFATLGGVLDLHGMPYDSNGEVCPTWLNLKALDSTSPQQPSPADPALAPECGVVFANAGFEEDPTRPEIPASCGSEGRVLNNWNFEEPSSLPSIPPQCGGSMLADGGVETGLVGAWHHTRSSSPLEVTTTTVSEGGYALHVPYPSSKVGQYIVNASSCLSAGVQYVFAAKVKLPAGAACYDAAQNHRNCPWSKLTYTDASGTTVTTSTLGDIEGKWGTDGEWNELYIGVVFTQEQLDSSELFLYIDVSGNGEFWVDEARLFQPPKPPQGWAVYDDRPAFIETIHDPAEAKEGEHFALISRRNHYGARVAQHVNVTCLTAGVHYLFSAWVRIGAAHPCYAGGACPNLRMRWRSHGGALKYSTLASPVDGAVPGEWMELAGDAIFESEPLEGSVLAGSEHVVYLEVAGEDDYAVDAVQVFLPSQAPPPQWSKRGEDGGFLAMVSDGTAFEGLSHLQVHGRDGDNSDYVFQVLGDRTSCLVPDVAYVVSVMVKLPDNAPCFSSDTNCPYLQLRTKDQGSEVYRWLGDINGYQGTDGAWNTLWALKSFTAAELAADEFFRLEVRVPGADDYWVDKAEILRAPQASNPADPCDDLLRNGDFEWHHGSWAPWYVGGKEKLMPAGGTDGGAYLLNFDRGSRSHGPQQYVDRGCVQTGAVYEFSAATLLAADHPCMVDGTGCPKLVIRTTTDGQHRYKTKTQPGGVPGEWNTFAHQFMFDAEDAASDAVYVYVEGGEAGWDVGFDSIALKRVSLGRNAVVVDGVAADGCWAVGDEVVVTSSDTRREHAERRRISLVEQLGDGTARVTLEENLEFMHEGEGPWHAEVMLLSRNILVHGTEWAPSRGGHFWVSHTAATQTIEGVELHTMGQQGTLGRYAMHLHMCQDMLGTSVSSLSIHDTFQRCVVIHGTDNATVQHNVAYNTVGHCYFLEDGYEEGTQFLHNIGAQTLAVPAGGLISSDETDDDPATFWISNPNNVFIGNVAAGSERSGFWFELRDRVRGPSAMLPKAMDYFGPGQRLDPEHHYMGVFRDNRAHSNQGNGLQTYPSRGYNPEYGWATFERFTTFRNRGAGVRFHISDHCRTVDLLAADNRRGVDDDRNHDIEILNSTIIGVSDAFQGSAHGVCPGSPAWGIELHQQQRFGSSRGTVLANVSFSGFDPAVCAGAAAITIDDEQQPIWDPRHLSSALLFDAASRRAYFPTVHPADLDMDDEMSDAQNQIAIQDVDGSLMGSPGYLVANNPDVVDSAACTYHGEQDPILSNLYTCPGACYRARQLTILPTEAMWPGIAQPQLEVTWVDGAGVSKTFLLNGSTTSTNSNRNQDHRKHHYYIVLPSGFDVTARFVLAGATYAPLFVESPLLASSGYADSDPTCAGAFASFSLDVGAPSPCGELFSNGDLEAGTDQYWVVRGMGATPTSGPTVVHDPANAASGSYYLKAAASARTGSFHGGAQFVPTARMREGVRYRLSVHVRLPGLAGGVTERMHMQLKLMSPGEASSYPTVGTFDYVGNSWMLLETELEWTAEMAAAQTALWYLSSIDSGLEVHLDGLSLQMAEACVDCEVDADCDDANACTGEETCGGGFCRSGAALACDDGRWCNGLEVCDPAAGCLAGAAPTCEGSTPVCNEATDACECSADAHCDTGLFCAPALCVSGQCEATPHGCGGLTPLCKEETDACVSECEVDGVCDFPYETAESCPDDCTTIQPVCGNGVCEPWGHVPETCHSCAADCDAEGIACDETQPEFVCGDGVVDDGETCANCPADAPPVTEDSAALCSDGLDNDCDGLIDGLDPACAPFIAFSLQGESIAAANVEGNQSGPAASAPVYLLAVVVAAASLLLVALVLLVRRRVLRGREERADAECKLAVISQELIFDVSGRAAEGAQLKRSEERMEEGQAAIEPLRRGSM